VRNCAAVGEGLAKADAPAVLGGRRGGGTVDSACNIRVPFRIMGEDVTALINTAEAKEMLDHVAESVYLGVIGILRRRWRRRRRLR